MKALRFSRSEGRYAAAMLMSRLRPGSGAAVGPLALVDDDEPALPTDEWLRIYPRLAGICGSDLATIDGKSCSGLTLEGVGQMTGAATCS